MPNINKRQFTKIDYRRVNEFIRQLSIIIIRYPNEFLTFDTNQPGNLLKAKVKSFFTITHVNGTLTMGLDDSIPKHIKDECLQLFCRLVNS